MKWPNYSGEYYILIPLPVFLHCIASFLTLFLLDNKMGMECNPFSAGLFEAIGLGPAMAIQCIVLTFILMLLPIVYRCVEKPSFAIYVLFGIMTLFMGLDAFHDILMIMNHPASEVTLRLIDMIFTPFGGLIC